METFVKSFLITICTCTVLVFTLYINYLLNIKAITSSPVEEMYHKKLVEINDSIFDARFGPGCCEDSTIKESNASEIGQYFVK